MDAPPGHNLPPLAELLAPEMVAQHIDVVTRPLKVLADKWAEACARYIAAHPEITSADQDAVAAELLAGCQRITATKTGKIDAARIALKAPVLDAQRAIDAAFPSIAAIVTKAAAPVAALSVAYKQSVEKRQREEAAAAAAAKQAEIDRLAAEAEAAKPQEQVVIYGALSDAYEAQDQARAIETAKPADLTRAHGDAAGVSSLQYERIVTVTAPHLVPRAYCVPSEAMLKAAAGKAGSPIPEIPGAKIEDRPKLRVGR